MEPIISPWIFYVIHVLDCMKNVSAILSGIFIGVYIFLVVDAVGRIEDINNSLGWLKCRYWRDRKIEIVLQYWGRQSKLSTQKQDVYTGYEVRDKEISSLKQEFEEKVERLTERYEDDLRKDKAALATILEKHEKNVTKGKAIFLYVGIFLAIQFVAIPSPHTIKAMLLASYVTPKNIDAITDKAKDSVDYIFEKIQSVVQKEEKK